MAKRFPVLPHVYASGDQLPVITGHLRPLQNITGWIVRLNLQRPADVLQIVGTIVDGPRGMFSIAFGATDLVAGEGQLAEVEFEDGGGKKLTSARFMLDVEEGIA